MARVIHQNDEDGSGSGKDLFVKSFAACGILYAFYMATFTVVSMDPIHNAQGLNKEGYWGEKTASVNFCETDYEYTVYIAEFWNMLSSFLIVMFPAVGMIYCNPTGELRFYIAYGVLVIVGLGSVCLHTSLTSFTQAFDEIPMLWMCLSIFYNLWDSNPNKSSNTSYAKPTCIWILVVLVTWLYFHIQDFYHVFVGFYLSMVLGIITWTARLALWDEFDVKKTLWTSALTCYVLIGSTVWVVDFFLCEILQSWHALMGGMTFHILWHLAAGLATHCMILFLIVLRLENLEKLRIPENGAKNTEAEAQVTGAANLRIMWKFNAVPIVTPSDFSSETKKII